MLKLCMIIFLALLLLGFNKTEASNTHGQPSMQEEMQGWFGDLLPGYAVSGCLPSTSGTVTASAFSCKAYIKSPSSDLVYVDQVASSVTVGDGDGTYWLGIYRNKASTVASWTRQGRTQYIWNKSVSQPTIPDNTLLLAKVTVAGSAITYVTDYRVSQSFAKAGVYDITDPLYGGKGDGIVGGGGTDNTPALNTILNATAVRGGVIWIPAGRYNFNSKPSAFQNGTYLRCAGHKFTVLVRKYTEADVAEGFIDMDIGNTLPVANVSNAGGGIHNCALYAESGTTGGSAINIVSRDTASQGFLHFDFVYITGAGLWNYNIRMDGTTAVTAPQGVRVVFISNSHLFQSDIAGILAIGVNNIGIVNVGVFTNTDQCLIIDGGTGGSVPTNYVRADMIFCDKAKIGATQDTNQVWFSSPNTTTLETSSAMSNLTVAGNIGTITGIASVGSSGVGMMTPGKVLAGVSVPTVNGGRLETRDGVTFPSTQIASPNANTLDDYKEALFTPTLLGSIANGTPTYTVQEGVLTKVGRLVTLAIRISWSNWIDSPSGDLRVSFSTAGVTANPGSGTGLYICASGSNSLVIGADKQLQGVISNAGQYIVAQIADLAGGPATNLVAGADTAGHLYFTCTFSTTP